MEQLQNQINDLALLLLEIDEMLEASVLSAQEREMVLHAREAMEREYLDATAKLGTWGQLILYRANKTAETGGKH
jgi:FtsZ-binding cell division protein ZapB